MTERMPLTALVRSLAKDWSLSGIFTYHSGLPVAFTGSGCPGTVIGQCMPSVVPNVQPRTASYAKPAGGVVAATGYANTYSTIHHLDLNAFTVVDGTNTLQYNLYTTAAFTTVMGDGTGGSVTSAGTGSGVATANALVVYGQLPDSATNQAAVTGNYSDLITVTVTY